MSRDEQQRQRNHQERRRRDARMPHTAASAEQNEGQENPGAANGPQNEKSDRHRVHPSDRCGQRSGRSTADLTREKERAECGDEESDRRGVGETVRDRNQTRKQREWAVHRRLRTRGEKRSGQHEWIPQRPLVALERVLHGSAPRKHLRVQIGQQAVVPDGNAEGHAHIAQRLGEIREFYRRVHAAGQQRAAGEAKRQKKKNRRGYWAEQRDETVREPQQRQRGSRVENQSHSAGIYVSRAKGVVASPSMSIPSPSGCSLFRKASRLAPNTASTRSLPA